MNPGNRRVAGLEEPPARPSRRSQSSIPAPDPRAGQRAARVFAGLRTLVGVALVAGTSLGVAWVARQHITTSPRFAIAEIGVSGNEHRASAAIVAESGLAIGTNVFAADLDAAQAKVLGDPWIAEATLSRRLPGTILVHVTERKAGALAALGDTYVTTPEGEPFKKLDPTDPADVTSLPLITGLRAEAMAEDHEGAARTIRRAIDLAAEFERTPLARRLPLQEVHVEADGAFSLVVGKNAMQLVLGGPPFRRKLDQAVRVVAELDKRGAKADSIMLDNDTRPDRVVVRMR
jgi:cell division protein FtsQ